MYPEQPIPSPADPFRTPESLSAQSPTAQNPTDTYAPDPTPAYNAVVAKWGALPQARQGASGWIIALLVISSLGLVVGLVATVIGGLALAATAGVSAEASGDDGYYGDTGIFGSAAAYGDYVEGAPFAGVTSVDGLEVGTCFTVDALDDDYVGDPVIGSCEAPHDYEVFSVKTIGGGQFPGFDDIAEYAYTTCEDKFPGYVGRQYYDSLAEYGALAPTEDAWEGGERALVCFAFTYDTNRDVPLRDSGE